MRPHKVKRARLPACRAKGFRMGWQEEIVIEIYKEKVVFYQ
jgi:hypothetical protein